MGFLNHQQYNFMSCQSSVIIFVVVSHRCYTQWWKFNIDILNTLVLKRKLTKDLINLGIQSSNVRDVSKNYVTILIGIFFQLACSTTTDRCFINWFRQKVTFPKNQPRSHVTGGHWRSNPERQTPDKVQWFLAFSHFASKKTIENRWSLTGKGSSTLSMVGCSNVSNVWTLSKMASRVSPVYTFLVFVYKVFLFTDSTVVKSAWNQHLGE